MDERPNWTLVDKVKEAINTVAGPLMMAAGAAGIAGGIYTLSVEKLGSSRYALAPIICVAAAGLIRSGINSRTLYRATYREIHRNLERQHLVREHREDQ